MRLDRVGKRQYFKACFFLVSIKIQGLHQLCQDKVQCFCYKYMAAVARLKCSQVIQTLIDDAVLHKCSLYTSRGFSQDVSDLWPKWASHLILGWFWKHFVASCIVFCGQVMQAKYYQRNCGNWQIYGRIPTSDQQRGTRVAWMQGNTKRLLSVLCWDWHNFKIL